jgi:single-strand DNA-binding protein
MSVNKAIIVGNVGSDPEIRHFDNGNQVANFSVATSESYKNKDGEKVTNTEWHKVAVFGKLAEVVEKWVTKGQQLYIEGKIKTRSWENKEGVKQFTTEIVVNGFGDKLEMLGGKPAGTNSSSNSEPTKDAPAPEAAPEGGDDDLPF